MFVGSTPTLVTAERDGSPGGLISRPLSVRIRLPQLVRPVVERQDAPLIRGRWVVRLHPGRLSVELGAHVPRVASLSCKQTGVGSIPTVSTERKVAGYGWPGRGANAVSPSRGMRVRLPHLPLDALVVKRTSRLASNEEVRVRLLAGVLTVPWSSGKGASPTRRRSVVRFHPGLLH